MKLLVLAASAIVTVSATAAPVTLLGSASNSTFDVVYESSQTGFFGTPVLLNNTITWTPITAVANAQGNGASAAANAAFMIRILPWAGYNVTQFRLVHRGDFFMSPEGSVAATSGMEISTGALLLTSGASGLVQDGPLAGQVLAALPQASLVHNEANHDWRINDLLSPAQAIVGAFDITLASTLSASNGNADPGAFPAESFIESKFIGLELNLAAPTSVPSPGTLALLIAGLVGLRRFGKATPRICSKV